jgi:hypothetical protein
MDMDMAYRGMGWCLLVFALSMFSLGHVMTGNGGDGFVAIDAQMACNRNDKAIGIEINAHTSAPKTYLCRR